ncbi:RING-H2 finger protein ATL16 [Platanthera zijinensis]|uniref:RING-type E3 ubiquitin transferase n=1 Tax=Platanthera zijinensis TaxID=2320716 RepID=A0AAP0BUT4_9ASPA
MSTRFLTPLSLPPPPPPLLAARFYSSMSLPIVAIAVLGILTTAIFLLAYYIFVIKCCLHLRRSDQLSPSLPSAGLDAASIRAIPTFHYSRSPPASAAAIDCAVCLSDFRGGEPLRLLPGCGHAFHIDCIDTWLQSNASCPLCRTHITDSFPPPPDRRRVPGQSPAAEMGHVAPTEQTRKLGYAVSMGDECIQISREKDEPFDAPPPLRRSVSMDSSFHRRLYVSVQDILRGNPNSFNEEGSSDGGGGGEGGDEVCGRARRRPFFPFGCGRSCSRAVQPVEDMHV